MSVNKWMLALIKYAALLIILIVLVAPTVHAQDPEEATGPSLDPRFGLIDTYINTSEASAAGAGWTPIFLRWDVIQPGGPGDWKPANIPDPQIEAELAAGRDIVAVLIGTPAWASETQQSTAVPGIEVWGEFVFRVATQYQGRINNWIIWHYPNVNTPTAPNYTWDGTVEDYAALLQEAYLKIKAVDPSMQVHVAGVSPDDMSYLGQLLDVLLVQPDAAINNYYFDALSLHVNFDPRQTLTLLTTARQLLGNRNLSDKAIWITDLRPPPIRDPLEPSGFESDFAISPAEHSAFILQSFALGLAGGADRIALYKLNNTPGAIPYGLVRGDNSRRPGFAAFQAVTQHFSGAIDADWQQVGRVYLVTLDRNGQTTTIVWNTASEPGQFWLNAIADQALLITAAGEAQPLRPNNGVYGLTLPAATCGQATCPIGGAPILIVENGSPGERAAGVPVQAAVDDNAESDPTTLPTATLPPTFTPTVTPPPTLTPTPVPPPPTFTPAPAAVAAAPTDAPPPAILPETAPAGAVDALPPSQGNTPPPEVTFWTVFTPSRIFQLFIIGLVVFTLSYGVQVVIWYRLKR